MSEPRDIIKNALDRKIFTCDEKRCLACRNTFPGCKTPQREKDRLEFNREICDCNTRYTLTQLTNMADLFFIYRCASMCFKHYTSETFFKFPKPASQTILMNSKRIYEKINNLLENLKWIPENATRKINDLSTTTLRLSSIDQRKVWSEFYPFLQTDFPAVSSHTPRKKGLMLSFAHWILMKRMLPREFFATNNGMYNEKFFHRAIFARIFNERLVRKKDSPKLFNLEDPMKSDRLLTNLR